MKIKQKRNYESFSFDFKEEELSYEHRDSGGALWFSIRYEEIPPTTAEIERNSNRVAWFLSIIWFFVGLSFVPGNPLELLIPGDILFVLRVIFGIAGLLALITVVKNRPWKYSIVDTHKGRIFIIQDNQYDEIMNEIDKRKILALNTHSENSVN